LYIRVISIIIRLKNVESEVKAINIGLDKDLKSLEEQKAEVTAQTSDVDNLKAEAQAIII
jgi:hypothetical protein